jgi:GAF domain-containing protein
MAGTLEDALDSLERSKDRPTAFSEPFTELFPISGATVSTVGSLLGTETLSATDAIAARVDELQFDLGEGPCWDALARGAPVLEPDIRQHPRKIWPAFSPAVAQEDVASLFAYPLMLGTLRIGAVDMYSSSQVELDPHQSLQAQLMAAVVGRHVLRRAIEESGDEHPTTDNAHSRRLVHQATGMVLAQLRLPADDARLVIHGHAFATNRSTMEVAEDIVNRKLVFTKDAAGIGPSS